MHPRLWNRTRFWFLIIDSSDYDTSQVSLTSPHLMPISSYRHKPIQSKRKSKVNKKSKSNQHKNTNEPSPIASTKSTSLMQ